MKGSYVSKHTKTPCCISSFYFLVSCVLVSLMLVTKRETKQRFLLLDRTGRVKELLYPVKSLSLGIGQGSKVASLAGANSVENT